MRGEEFVWSGLPCFFSATWAKHVVCVGSQLSNMHIICLRKCLIVKMKQSRRVPSSVLSIKQPFLRGNMKKAKLFVFFSISHSPTVSTSRFIKPRIAIDTYHKNWTYFLHLWYYQQNAIPMGSTEHDVCFSIEIFKEMNILLVNICDIFSTGKMEW